MKRHCVTAGRQLHSDLTQELGPVLCLDLDICLLLRKQGSQHKTFLPLLSSSCLLLVYVFLLLPSFSVLVRRISFHLSVQIFHPFASSFIHFILSICLPLLKRNWWANKTKETEGGETRRKEGRSEGREEGREEARRQEGRQEGRKAGTKEGRKGKERRKEGIKGRKEGKN